MKLNNSEIVIYQRQFYRTGVTRDLHFRKDMLKKLDKALMRYEGEFLEALEKDFGKNRIESWLTEVYTVRSEISHTLKHLKKWMRHQGSLFPGLARFPARTSVVAEPKGTVLIISPWNYPLQLALAPLTAALAAGNTAVIKTSELAPHVSTVLSRMIGSTFDPGLVTVVEGGVEETTDLLTNKFDHIFFTGSTRVGRIIMRAAAEQLTPVTLELGGKSPCIVDETADLNTAARRIVWGKFINAGQTCIAPDYLLVQDSVKDELIKKMVQAVRDFYGETPLDNPDFAGIINGSHFKRLTGLIDREKIVAGGERDEETLRMAPVILDGISWDDPIMKEEIFGPLLPVLSFGNFDDLENLLSGRPSPLALYLFSRDRKRQKHLMSTLSFGGGCINDTVLHMTDSRFPFGGVGDSGMGSYHGEAGFKTFSHEKTILKNRPRFDLPLRYPPYGRGIVKLLKILNPA
ncbi:MAG: aldehyde dehydrogenase [Spirochaetales bacterium]|nr:aldehyde dehydrogenase [Spirochaetales bacterium]